MLFNTALSVAVALLSAHQAVGSTVPAARQADVDASIGLLIATDSCGSSLFLDGKRISQTNMARLCLQLPQQLQSQAGPELPLLHRPVGQLPGRPWE